MYLCKEPGLYIMSFTRDLIVFFTLLNNSVEEMLLSTHECAFECTNLRESCHDGFLQQ